MFNRDIKPGDGYKIVSPAHVAALPDTGEVLFLDVRTLREWNCHRIPGATLLPVQELAARVNELDPSRPTLRAWHPFGSGGGFFGPSWLFRRSDDARRLSGMARPAFARPVGFALFVVACESMYFPEPTPIFLEAVG